MCKSLPENPRDLQFLKFIVSCNLQWTYLLISDNQKQLLDVGQTTLPVAVGKEVHDQRLVEF